MCAYKNEDVIAVTSHSLMLASIFSASYLIWRDGVVQSIANTFWDLADDKGNRDRFSLFLLVLSQRTPQYIAAFYHTIWCLCLLRFDQWAKQLGNISCTCLNGRAFFSARLVDKTGCGSSSSEFLSRLRGFVKLCYTLCIQK